MKETEHIGWKRLETFNERFFILPQLGKSQTLWLSEQSHQDQEFKKFRSQKCFSFFFCKKRFHLFKVFNLYPSSLLRFFVKRICIIFFIRNNSKNKKQFINFKL